MEERNKEIKEKMDNIWKIISLGLMSAVLVIISASIYLGISYRNLGWAYLSIATLLFGMVLGIKFTLSVYISTTGLE